MMAVWLVVALVLLWAVAKMAGGLTALIGVLVIGAVAGWLAGKYMRGRGFGLLKNILVGIVGSLVGRLLLGLIGLYSASMVGSLATATIGAIVLLSFVRWLRT